MSTFLPPVSQCKGCGADIYWLTNERTQKVAPIDATPDPKGPISINPIARTYAVLTKAQRAEPSEAARYTNHWQTCPAKERFRKPKRV